MYTQALNMTLRRTLCLIVLVCITIHCTLARAEDNTAKTFTLVIDAGHGGHDAGAVGSFSKEKNINLNVALEFGRLVKENCPNVRVIYTRKTDVFVPLEERAEIANRNKADLFVSIHTNALPNGKIAYGSETYTMGMARAASNLEVAKRENAVITYEKDYQERYAGFDPNKAESYIIFEYVQDRYMKQSVELARCIQKQYVKNGRKDKGVHQAGFLVLRATTMPSVLTELGFISTPEEERYLNSDEGVKTLARSIYNGFCTFRGLTPVAESPTPTSNNEQVAPAKAIAQAEQPALTEPKTEKVQVKEQPKQEGTPVSEPKAAVQSTAEVPTKAKTDTVRQAAATPKPAKEQTKTTGTKPNTTSDKPIFKIQIMTSDRKLSANDPHFKGLKGIESYTEGNVIKYTYGASTDYNEIRSLQRTINDKFTGTFIIALRDGKRMDLGEAIRISKK